MKFKSLLEIQKKELSDSIQLAVDSAQPVALDQTVQGRVSRGDALQQQQMAKAGVERNKKHLTQVVIALKRIEDDDYGFCLECGESINLERLDIMPEAELCILCQQKHD